MRIAIELVQRALADTAPRRSTASSITSSWYSVERWVSSIATAAGTTAGGLRIPEAGREQHHQRPEALATRLDQMAGGLGDERVVALDRRAQQILDRAEPAPDRRLQRRVDEIQPWQARPRGGAIGAMTSG